MVQSISASLGDSVRWGSADPVEIRNALAQTEGYVGVSGTIGWSPEDRFAKGKPVVICRIENGARRSVRKLTIR